MFWARHNLTERHCGLEIRTLSPEIGPSAVLGDAGTVAASPAPPRVQDSGETLQLESATPSPLLKRLGALGYITRTKDSADQRTLTLDSTADDAALRQYPATSSGSSASSGSTASSGTRSSSATRSIAGSDTGLLCLGRDG